MASNGLLPQRKLAANVTLSLAFSSVNWTMHEYVQNKTLPQDMFLS